jgi:hypothetical protein
MKPVTLVGMVLCGFLTTAFAALNMRIAERDSDLPYPLVPMEVTGTVNGEDFRLQGTYDVGGTRVENARWLTVE